MNNGIGRVWAVNAEGGDEGRPNGVGPVWIENADQLGSKLPEPESGDAGKVLGVLNSDGDIGWVPDQEGMAQVQADWDQDDSSQVSYIANKPTIPSGTQLVPAATSADENKVLTVDSLGVPGWAVVPEQSTGLFQAVYGDTSFADITQAFNDKKIVYCRIGSTRPSRMAYLAYVNASYFEFQYYRSNPEGVDSVFIYTVTSSGWTTTERQVNAGNISYPVTEVNVNGSSAMTGTVANITIPAAPTVDQAYNASSTNAQSGVAVAQAIAAIPSSSYTAGDGIAISEQGAISAVGGTGITVTAESTTTKSITVHSQDYVPTWTSTEQHTVDYVSLLDSNIVSDIQNGGIDVTLAYPFYQFVDYSSSLNDYLDDWQSSSYQSRFKAYAAIVELDPDTTLTPTAYFGNIQNRLVLGEVSAPWIANNYSYPAIADNTVVRYDFDEVNTSLSTITLSSVLANLSNYCMTVLFYDSRINAFDNGAYHSSCTLSGVTGAGDYTTGSYQGISPSAINVTNPVPAYSAGDAGKVLQVNAGGTGTQWTNYVPAEVVQALPANPTSGVLYIVTGA